MAIVDSEWSSFMWAMTGAAKACMCTCMYVCACAFIHMYVCMYV